MKTNINSPNSEEKQNPEQPLKEQEKNTPPEKERNDHDFHRPEANPQNPGQEGKTGPVPNPSKINAGN
jgi:hypothetical protein